jgi:hypothetical protein
VEAGGIGMRILVVSPNEFTGDDLAVGKEYEAVPAEDATDRQNRAFHALLGEYWKSGAHSYNAKNYDHFREIIKLNLGAGVERYYSLIDDDGTILQSPRIKWRIKSWGNYTKKERKETIDNLIAEMHQAGVQTKKFYEILEGMEKHEG